MHKKKKVHTHVQFCKQLATYNCSNMYTVFKKKHPLVFSFISPRKMCRFP